LVVSFTAATARPFGPNKISLSVYSSGSSSSYIKNLNGTAVIGNPIGNKIGCSASPWATITKNCGRMYVGTSSEGSAFQSVNSLSDTKKPHVDKVYFVDKLPDTTIRTQNPTNALFKSMFFPGAGQFDNGKYLKGSIIFTVEVLLFGTIIHYTEKTTRARRAFENARDGTGTFWGDNRIPASYESRTISETEIARLFNEYRNAQDQRNLFRWYLGTFIFFSMFDAFVDAHLARFPKYGEKLSFDFSPTDNGAPAVSLSYNFW
jgi:TM2 domain-containing membrane protein YozV